MAQTKISRLRVQDLGYQLLYMYRYNYKNKTTLQSHVLSSLHTTQNGVDWEGHAPKNCIEDEGLDRGKLLQRDHPLPTWPTGILQDRQLHYFRAPRRTEARRETLKKKFKKATMVTLLSRDHAFLRSTQPPSETTDPATRGLKFWHANQSRGQDIRKPDRQTDCFIHR